jgi:hypothetical protein
MNWQPRKRTEQEYERSIFGLFANALEESERSGVPVRLLSGVEFLARYAEQAALRMITALYFAGARTWREAARASGKTALMYQALQREMRGPVGARVRELVRENARLIGSFPQSVASAVAARAAAQQQAGGRASELAARSSLLRRAARWRARLVARTEVSKASTALTQARSEALGLPWYVWETSQDQRVRASHRKMQGVLVAWADPPSPELLVGEKGEGHYYNAGDIYNCRCYPAPLVRLDQISWPHRVYRDGAVRYMTLSQFKRLNQQEVAA